MRQKIGRLMVLLVGATVALAVAGMGYGLWFETLTISGTVETGTVVLAFVDDPGTGAAEPYTNDDTVVNNPAQDPSDTGVCASPIIDDDGDGVEGEDPVDGVDNDGDLATDEDPPGKKTSCDPRSTSVWSTGFVDEDGDGLLDEDPANGLDDDGDGLVDEDGVGGWVLPFAPSANGPDIGTTAAFIDGGGQALGVMMGNPSVALLNKVYSPTVWATVTNAGTVPVVVSDIRMTLAPAYELWDRDQNGILLNTGGAGCDLGLGDECAAPLTALLTGIAVGDSLDPGEMKPVTLKLSMTPAAVPGGIYSLTLTIFGNQYNEP